jgi:hypothetical protein
VVTGRWTMQGNFGVAQDGFLGVVVTAYDILGEKS